MPMQKSIVVVDGNLVERRRTMLFFMLHRADGNLAQMPEY